MLLLGINGAYHELAAAIVRDGTVVAAAEEERFNRRKHGADARVDNADEIPAAAIVSCLEMAALDPGHLDAICFSFDPALRARNYRPDPYAQEGDWGHPSGEATFLASLERVPEALSRLFGFDVGARFHWVSHHLAHAASAFYTSGFDSAAILVVDGIGEQATGLLGKGDGSRIEVIDRVPFPHSLGFVWEKMSRYLGFGEYDACKVMGLAAYGDASAYRQRMHELVAVEDGSLRVAAHSMQFRRQDFDGLSESLGAPESACDTKRRDLAAALQSATDDVMCSLARTVHAATGSRSLCIAGGVGLNCRANWLIKEEGPFERIYIPSAPHDAGTAIGAALHYYYCSAPDAARDVACEDPSPYLGPSYSLAAIEGALARRQLSAREPRSVEHEAARLISEGKIVGWFQDRMEFGPRALGNRSLLADPRTRATREHLNQKVKHREPFRPFAPSVLSECCTSWLTRGRDSASYGFMSFACPVHQTKRDAIPAVVHVDGSSRVQLVERSANPRFHTLISEFKELTGVPMVLNTSFNDSEPIVCSPDDALNTFLSTRIDAVVLGPLVIER